MSKYIQVKDTILPAARVFMIKRLADIIIVYLNDGQIMEFKFATAHLAGGALARLLQELNG